MSARAKAPSNVAADGVSFSIREGEVFGCPCFARSPGKRFTPQ